MPTIEETIIISCQQKQIFNITQDYSIRRKWDPFTKEYRLLKGAQKVEKGTQIFVRAYNGLKMTVRYVNLIPPKRAAMVMLEGPFFLKSFAGSWVFEDLEHNITLVRFRYHYESKFHLIRPSLNFMIGLVLRKEIKCRLLGLKKYSEKNHLQ